MSELIFAPSEFAFGYSGCKRCYYDLKNDNIRVSTAFPSIFSKLDRLQKEFYHNKSSDVLNANIDDGKVYAKEEKEKIEIFDNYLYSQSIKTKYNWGYNRQKFDCQFSTLWTVCHPLRKNY